MLGVAALGCATADDVDDSWGESEAGGKADGFRDSGTVFFVYDNHRVCVTAPCPSYTVITPGAVRFDVARVTAERDGEAAVPLLATGGVLVNGAVEDGSWQPGEEGPGLRIEKVIEPAEGYLVARQPEDSVHPFALVGAGEIENGIDRIDLEGFVATDDGTQTLATLVTGEWAAKGFLGHDDTGERVFFVTASAGSSYPCAVVASGIQCVTDPCPLWRLESMDGQPLGYASAVDVGYLGLGDKESARILDQLFASGGDVVGWLTADSWEASGGDVLLVVEVLALAPAP